MIINLLNSGLDHQLLFFLTLWCMLKLINMSKQNLLKQLKDVFLRIFCIIECKILLFFSTILQFCKSLGFRKVDLNEICCKFIHTLPVWNGWILHTPNKQYIGEKVFYFETWKKLHILMSTINILLNFILQMVNFKEIAPNLKIYNINTFYFYSYCWRGFLNFTLDSFLFSICKYYLLSYWYANRFYSNFLIFSSTESFNENIPKNNLQMLNLSFVCPSEQFKISSWMSLISWLRIYFLKLQISKVGVISGLTIFEWVLHITWIIGEI